MPGGLSEIPTREAAKVRMAVAPRKPSVLPRGLNREKSWLCFDMRFTFSETRVPLDQRYGLPHLVVVRFEYVFETWDDVELAGNE